MPTSSTDLAPPTLRPDPPDGQAAESGGEAVQGSMVAIDEARALVLQQTPREFEAEHGRWWLVRKPGNAGVPITTEPETLTGVTHEMLRVAQTEREDDWMCCPIRKRPFSELARITVGRGARCDVVLLYPRVSRLHASCLISEDGTIDLADNASANGTSVAGHPIHNVPIPLPDGAPIEIAGVQFTVVSAPSLHAALSSG